MKKLEKYGVLEMDAKELNGTDGGFPWVGAIGIFLAVEGGLYSVGKDIGKALKKMK